MFQLEKIKFKITWNSSKNRSISLTLKMKLIDQIASFSTFGSGDEDAHFWNLQFCCYAMKITMNRFS